MRISDWSSDVCSSDLERGDEAAAVAEAARGEHRDLHLVGRRGDQDQPRDIILAGMARAFEAVDRDAVAARLLRRQRVAPRGAFVEDGDTVGLPPRPDLAHRLGARGTATLDPAVDEER